MKPCPQCAAPLHFVANRWLHVSASSCPLILLQATPDEIAKHTVAPTLAGARYRKAQANQENEWKFGYLAPGAEGAAD
jgi:hypothetical protein